MRKQTADHIFFACFSGLQLIGIVLVQFIDMPLLGDITQRARDHDIGTGVLLAISAVGTTYIILLLAIVVIASMALTRKSSPTQV